MINNQSKNFTKMQGFNADTTRNKYDVQPKASKQKNIFTKLFVQTKPLPERNSSANKMTFFQPHFKGRNYENKSNYQSTKIGYEPPSATRTRLTSIVPEEAKFNGALTERQPIVPYINGRPK